MKLIQKLDTVLEEIIACWGIPGMGIGIVDGNEIVYKRGFGVQNLETKEPVTPDSIFCVASISKCFVATAIMQLAEKGIFQLDDPIVQHLPYFTLNDERCRQITIRQMLSHTSGMPDMDEGQYDDLVSHLEYDEGAAERYVRGLSSRKMISTPGECFWYSNIAYNVLGDLISKVSGEIFEDYMKARILRPSGMPDSTFFFPEVQPGRLAVPHLRIPEMVPNPVYPYHRADAPASFLHSSVVEMCHWCITCLNNGIFSGKPILSTSGFEQMWTPVAPRGYPPFYESSGLGWTLGHFDGVKTVSHGGMGFGWTDFLILLPEKNRAAIILCNEESSARSQTLQAVVHAMLDQEPHAGVVSWMIPIGKALQIGGIQAANAFYEEIKNRGDQTYLMDEDELVILAYQMLSSRKFDQVIDLLRLNLHAFPNHIDSYHLLANAYLRKGNPSQAKEVLFQALAINPDDRTTIELIGKIH